MALPVEHGGWGFLLEPVALGLLVAPSAAGLALGLAALGAFLARHPLKLVLLDRGKALRTVRTAAGERLALAYGVAAILALLAAWALAGTRPLVPLLAAAPLGLVQVLYDARNRSRSLAPELSGAVALGSLASGIALAGGWTLAPALALWALLGSRAVASVLYVRARLRLDRGQEPSLLPAWASHLAAVGLAAALFRAGWAPALAVLALSVLLLRAAHGLSPWHRPVRPQVVGLLETGFGALTVVLLTLGYRFGV
ncbi:MAG TPA: YwiC-like family protein [Vicinamibacteria bacterium]|nr:YwiC-like family protein [Vicinamibacteria bacterium]